MKEISCNVIGDILPLYVDGVVCDDTKIIVEEHLRRCPACRKEAALLENRLALPADSKGPLEDAQVIRGFRKKWRNKKILIVSLSIMITFAACFSLFQWMNNYEVYIPYDQSLFSVTSKSNGSVVIHYYGETFAGVREFGTERTKSRAASFDSETGENLGNIGYFYCYDTLWSKYVTPLFSKNEKGEHSFVFGQGDVVDSLYYGDFEKDLNMELEDYQKIWSRQ